MTRLTSRLVRLFLPFLVATLLSTIACDDEPPRSDASIRDAWIRDGGADAPGPAVRDAGTDAPGPAVRDAGTDARPIDSTDAGPRDADFFCHWDCFRSYFCVDGVVHESEHRPVPCREWTGACGHWPIDAGCVRGCREGVYRDRPEDVCEENVPKRPGDPCTEPSHCEPGQPADDGFGGLVKTPLDCDTSHGVCVARAVESCDGHDDDADGAIDEGCAASPVIVARPSGPGVYRDAAIGPDRIALLRAHDSGPVLTVVDVAGATLVTIESGLEHAHHVERVAGGFALLRHAELGPVHEIVVVQDDGGRRTIPLSSWPATRYARLVPYGADWVVLGADDREIPLQVHAADGTRRGASRITSEWPFMATSMLLTTDELLLVSGQTADRWRVTRIGSASPIARGPVVYNAISEIVPLGTERVAVAHASFRHVLVDVDPESGQWTTDTELGRFPSTPVLARAGEGVLVSWLDGTRLRSITLDASRARTAATVVELGAREPALIASGETNAGPRVVLATETGWIIVAPLGAP